MATKVTHSSQMGFMIEQRMIRLELYNLLEEKQRDFKQCIQLQKELHKLKSDFVARNYQIYECGLKDKVAKTDRQLSGMMRYVRNSKQGSVNQETLRKIQRIREVNDNRRTMSRKYDRLVREMDGEEEFNEARLNLIVEIVSIWIYYQTEKDARKSEEREKEGEKKQMKKTLEEYVDDLLKKLNSKENVEMHPMENSLKQLFEQTYIQIEDLQSTIQILKNGSEKFQVESDQHFPPSQIYVVS